jgi:hypothetical protein
MTNISKTIITAFFIFWASSVMSLSLKSDSLRYEVLMSSKMLQDINLEINFINSIDITANNLLLLSSTDQFYVLGWGGISPLGAKIAGNISCYSITPDNFLMVVSKNNICRIDSLGNLSAQIKLPNTEMGLSAGKHAMFVFDQSKGIRKNAVYLIAKGSKYAKLFEITTPINSVVEMNDSLLFATKSGLFSFNFKNKDIRLLSALRNDQEIKSIAIDTTNDIVCFSTDSVVYAFNDSKTEMITNKFGGMLRFLGDGLVVFDPEHEFLIRIAGLEDIIAPNIQKKKTVVKNKRSSSVTLTNSSIIKMINEKLSDDQIIKIINSSNVDFNMSTNSVIALTNQNVSSAIIEAMAKAIENK